LSMCKISQTTSLTKQPCHHCNNLCRIHDWSYYK